MFEYLTILLLVAGRLAGLVVFAPVFAGPGVPMRLRLFLLIGLAATLGPMLAARDAAVLSPVTDAALIPLLGREVVLGLIIGFAASLPFLGARMGGILMGQQMGLGIAALFDPGAGDQCQIIGRLLWLLAIAGFVLLGGHELLLLAVLHSFEHMPPGIALSEIGWLGLLSGLLLSAFELALRVAAPLLALIMLESIAVGFLGRTVPQLNILSVGFPLRILLGLAVLLIGVTAMGDVVMDGVEDAIGLIGHTSGPRS
jgi:flagellar biosynthetic protein FliR